LSQVSGVFPRIPFITFSDCPHKNWQYPWSIVWTSFQCPQVTGCRDPFSTMWLPFSHCSDKFADQGSKK
jgi:hypothetical protein